MAGVLHVGRRGDGDRAGVRDVGHEAPRDDHRDVGGLGELHELDGEGAPAEGGLDALDEDDVAAERGVRRDEHRVVRQLIRRRPFSSRTRTRLTWKS